MKIIFNSSNPTVGDSSGLVFGALPAGVKLDNTVTIVTSDDEEDDTNNEDSVRTSIPGIDVSIEKTSNNEGLFPGHIPGDTHQYTITVYNSGTLPACAIEIVDTLPADWGTLLHPGTPLHSLNTLQLTDNA